MAHERTGPVIRGGGDVTVKMVQVRGYPFFQPLEVVSRYRDPQLQVAEMVSPTQMAVPLYKR